MGDEIHTALERRCSDFASLLVDLPGIYPEVVLESLRSLAVVGGRTANQSALMIESAMKLPVVPPAPSGLAGLPPPHPLDFEWRFSPRAIVEIADTACEIAPTSGRIGLVATPTLAVVPNLLHDRCIVDYIGHDSDQIAGIAGARLRESVYGNLMRRPMLSNRYHVLIMDPPWYNEHIPRFLHFAAHTLELGGHLLLAMPAIGTRPGAVSENARALAIAEALGFRLCFRRLGAIPYETPPFERNALRAIGIYNVGAEWRRGDLWVLRKEYAAELEWPGDIIPKPWRELRFGPVRIRVDARRRDSGKLTLRSLVEGDVLPTVSRSDRRRASATVWTTGNRVFACDAPEALLWLFESEPGGSRMRRAMSQTERHVRNRVFSIVERERSEMCWPSSTQGEACANLGI